MFLTFMESKPMVFALGIVFGICYGHAIEFIKLKFYLFIYLLFFYRLLG